MQPRMSYLFLITPQLVEFFAEYLDMLNVSKDDYWYSYRGEPLRFDIPLGVLYDTLIHKTNEDDSSLPFKITLNYRNFPSHTLQKGIGSKNIFPQSLKESAMMRIGKATVVQDKLDQVKTMLNAIKEGKYDDFWRYNEELLQVGPNNQLKYFPVRVVINKHYHPYMSAKDKQNESSKTNMFVIQRPIKVNGKDIWIGEFLTRVLPKYFHIQAEVVVEEDQNEEDQNEEEKKEPEEIEYVEKTNAGTEVIINGLKIDLDLSLSWLVLNLAALDNFLYITVRVASSHDDN